MLLRNVGAYIAGPRVTARMAARESARYLDGGVFIPPMPPTAHKRKQLHLVDATMIMMGSMIASGIFLAPALIGGVAVKSQLSAGSIVLVWIVGGVLTLGTLLLIALLSSGTKLT